MINPNWQFAGIFSDEGISGTTVEKRKGFQSMIEAAQNHEIDLILTKSISCFGRNIIDILTNLQLLNALSPPVSVNFEMEGIGTSDGKNNFLISLLSALAELESQQKSEAIKAGIRYRMHEAIYKFSVSNMLGYYRDHFGQIKTEPAEAEIVKYIYDSFIEGVTLEGIANTLSFQGIRTPKGLYKWRSNTIRSILTNEKYCGDALMQKTYTKNFLTHKSVKNRNILPMYFTENHHAAIIDRCKWNQVQELLINRKNNSTVILPKSVPNHFMVTRIKSGSLKGYFLIDTTWTKQEREQFLKIIGSVNNLNDER